MKLFSFFPGTTTSIAATATSASATVNGYAKSVRLYNKGPNTAFVKFGVGATTATASDMPLPAGAIETFSKDRADTIAAICAATETATVYVTSGEGM
jgi:hypothetical protein